MSKPFRYLVPLFICFSFPALAAGKFLPGKNLMQEDALARSTAVREVHYDLSVVLDGKKPDYNGVQEISFSLLKNTQNLRLDYKDGLISKLTVNDRVISPVIQDDQAFYIQPSNLHEGANKVKVEFTHAYGKNGIGLHRFLDPEDGKVYLYTNFEPNDASRFMPCFDQPDIKGTYSAEVTAPRQWVVISSKRESKILPGKDFDGELINKWVFPTSWPMSTYVFAIIAGEYKVWNSKAGTIPLRILARESLGKYIDVNFWFQITKQGLAYYGKYFGVAFPYGKYDQAIVPEFTAGAMENIAAVTFSERYIKRGFSTKNDRENIAGVVLHEMAHMWFGDLVTMKWWNDLWLNESFASYMAAKSAAEATEFKNSWVSFFGDDKAWAYLSDQMSTTHPISAKIESAAEVYNAFDGITYGKGASTLKQLAFLIGDKDFQKGLQNYFKKYSYKNADLKEFIAALQEETSIDLSRWSQTWLETQGVDTLKSDFTCKDGRFEKLKLKFDSVTPESPRIHAFDVVFLNLINRKLETSFSTTLRINDTAELSQKDVTKNLKCPDVVFTNSGDYGYFKSQLDDNSLAHLKSHLVQTSDLFLRRMFWGTLWQMTRDQKISLQEYSDVVMKNLAPEKSFQIIFAVLKTISGGGHWSKNSVYYFFPSERRGQLMKRQELTHQMEDLYLAQAENAKPGSDLQQLWMDGYVTAAETNKGQEKLVQWLSGKFLLKGLSYSPDRRWEAIIKLCALGNPKGEEYMRSEKAKDKSHRGEVSAYQCQAANPDLESKKAWWNKIVDPKSEISFDDKRAAMSVFYSLDQKTFYGKNFNDEYFKVLSHSQDYPEDFLEYFTFHMGPDNCSPFENETMKNFLAKGNLSPVTVKQMKDVIDINDRCIKIRAKANQSPAQNQL